MQKVLLEEGWVKFTRIYCKEGFIDVWTGDAYHNPNDKVKSKWCINSFAVYVRLNGEGEWVKPKTRTIRGYIEDCKDNTTAKEIFKTLTDYDK